jgi:hypothetical protein
MGLVIRDVNDLAGKLNRLSHVRFEAAVIKNMTQIYNRGKANGGTPVDTGELRTSLGQSGDTVGYAKDYAPHVEYGHRTVNGGYVEGQRFLQRNVRAQEPIFRQDLIDQLRKL